MLIKLFEVVTSLRIGGFLIPMAVILIGIYSFSYLFPMGISFFMNYSSKLGTKLGNWKYDSNLKRECNPVKDIKKVPHKSKRTKREYPLYSDGSYEINTPDDFISRVKHYTANFSRPAYTSDRFKHAQNLNIKYFMSTDYIYDYIVLGDRITIEEVRKGTALTLDEQELVYLGYGYDGDPFGTPWGIAEESAEDYKFADDNHDFIKYSGADTNRYKTFLESGYGQFDTQHGINEDSISIIEDKRNKNGESIQWRISKKHLT